MDLVADKKRWDVCGVAREVAPLAGLGVVRHRCAGAGAVAGFGGCTSRWLGDGFL